MPSRGMKSSRRDDQLLSLLGLAARAGGVVPGTERVRLAARKDTVHLVLIADDASENSREKLVPLLRAKGIPFHIRYTRMELGGAVGRSPLSAIGLTDASLARRARELIGVSGVQE